MLIMTRLLFNDAAKAALGIAALHKQGFTVLSCVYEDEPGYTFCEASRDEDVPNDTDELNAYELNDRVMQKVQDIVAPYGGDISDTGPLAAAHVPFEYEIPAEHN